MMKMMNVVIAREGEINLNGLKFTRECLINAVNAWREERISRNTGLVFLGDGGNTLDNVAGLVENVKIVDENQNLTVTATINILVTPKGEITGTLLSAKVPLTAWIGGRAIEYEGTLGIFGTANTISNFKITHISLTTKSREDI